MTLAREEAAIFGSTRESGVGLVEFFLGSTALAVVVLGTVGGLMTSLKFTIDTKDKSLAEDDAVRIREKVRDAAERDFESALHTYAAKQMKGTGNRRVRTRIILDETCFDPPIDLNGDGDFGDDDLRPMQVNAAFIETRVLWGRNKSLTTIDLVRRTSPRPKNVRTKLLAPRSSSTPDAGTR